MFYGHANKAQVLLLLSEMIPYFFAIMQGGLIPVYLADITALSAKHPFYYFFYFATPQTTIQRY